MTVGDIFRSASQTHEFGRSPRIAPSRPLETAKEAWARGESSHGNQTYEPYPGRSMLYVVKIETEHGPRFYGPYSSREYAGNASHGANGVEIHPLLPAEDL
jgi:hypothetical protein